MDGLTIFRVIRAVVRFLLEPETLELLRSIAEQTDTPLDDLIVGVLEDARNAIS